MSYCQSDILGVLHFLDVMKFFMVWPHTVTDFEVPLSPVAMVTSAPLFAAVAT